MVIALLPETKEFYNISSWLKDKLHYHNLSKIQKIKRANVTHGEVWYCDFGYNIGAEKNKCRPVIVISNNRINKSEKVVVLCITDAKGKTNINNLPAQDSWFLMYSATTDDDKKIYKGRKIPLSMSVYSFLDKDSVIQCEEIHSISKARLDMKRGCIGTLSPTDFQMLKRKISRAYSIDK